MRKTIPLLLLTVLGTFTIGCISAQSARGNYKKTISTKDFQKALNAALSNNSFAITYSNDQGNVTTDWKSYRILLTECRVKLIINFSDGNLLIKPITQAMGQYGWGPERNYPDEDTKRMVAKVVRELSEMLKTEIPFTWVDEKPE